MAWIAWALAVGLTLLIGYRRRRRRHLPVDRVSDAWLDEHHRY